MATLSSRTTNVVQVNTSTCTTFVVRGSYRDATHPHGFAVQSIEIIRVL
jgi:hypothetical protein